VSIREGSCAGRSWSGCALLKRNAEN